MRRTLEEFSDNGNMTFQFRGDAKVESKCSDAVTTLLNMSFRMQNQMTPFDKENYTYTIPPQRRDRLCCCDIVIEHATHRGQFCKVIGGSGNYDECTHKRK